MNIADIWNILHTFVSSKLHVSKPEMKNIHMHWCKKFWTSTEIYVIEDITDQFRAKIVVLMRGLGKRDVWLENCRGFLSQVLPEWKMKVPNHFPIKSGGPMGWACAEHPKLLSGTESIFYMQYMQPWQSCGCCPACW